MFALFAFPSSRCFSQVESFDIKSADNTVIETSAQRTDSYTKTFEEVRPDLEKKMRPELTREAMDKMRKQTPVSLDDSYFGK